MTESPKKINTRAYKRRLPVSEDTLRTKQYAARVFSMYSGLFVVMDTAVYVGPKHCVSHRCLICGSVEKVKPSSVLSGRGCTVCKTNAVQMQALTEHIERLKNAHNGRYVLIGKPPRFTGLSKELHQCTKCLGQHLVKPDTILNPDFQCNYCVEHDTINLRTKSYKQRLDMLYGGTIKLISKLSTFDPMPHSCSCNPVRPHIWLARIEDMLMGEGCPKCGNKVEVKRLEKPVYRRGKEFVLRRKLEGQALKAIAMDMVTLEDLKTALDFPIPILGKTHIPAFFSLKSHKLIDVTTYEKFTEHRKRFIFRYNAANKLGLRYSVVIIRGKDVVMLNTRDWLASMEKKLPKQIQKNDYVLGNGNIRAKVYEGEEPPTDPKRLQSIVEQEKAIQSLYDSTGLHVGKDM